MSYVYQCNELLDNGQRLCTVGFFDPDGIWHPESDHEDGESAAARVHYLNGGVPVDVAEVKEKCSECDDTGVATSKLWCNMCPAAGRIQERVEASNARDGDDEDAFEVACTEAWKVS